MVKQVQDRSEKKSLVKEGMIWLMVIGILAVSGVTATRIFGQRAGQPAGEAAPIRILYVAAMPIEKQDAYIRTRSFLGKVESRRSSRLGFELGGMLDGIYVQEGEAIKKNQLLARLDTDRLNAAKREAEAQLIEARAALTLAEATLKRTRQAQRLKAVSAQQLDEAAANMETQRARVVRVQAHVNRIAVDLKKSRLYAPYSGTLATRMSDEGTVLSPGQPVLEITETSRTEIRIGFDRDLSADLTPGTRIRARVRGQDIALRIDRILPGRERTTRVVQVIAVPVSNHLTLREADLVEVKLDQKIARQGVWMPVSALTENARGLWSCMVAQPLPGPQDNGGATHKLKRRDLEIISMEQDRVFVSGHFQPGDQVVTDGIHRVVPDQRVRLADTALSAKQSGKQDPGADKKEVL